MAIEFPTLYTIDSKDKVRAWRMEVDGDRYRTISGLLDGAQVESAWKVATPKNIGKSNATTGAEQALAEVEAEYKKKRDRKYHDDLATVGKHKFIAPMLAEKYKKWTGTCYTQPKLDGIRCIATKDGLTSRQGKPFFLPHIVKALEPIFKMWPDVILDGELYNHHFRDNFNKISSLVKKQSRTPEEEAECERYVEYHIYDCVNPDDKFVSRILHIKGMLTICHHPKLVWVNTQEVQIEKTLDEYFEKYLEDGYEGQIVRFDAPYEIGQRSDSLLKRKNFIDEEFELVSVMEGLGNWAGYAKSAKFRKRDGTEFEAGIKGDQEFTRKLLEEWPRYRAATVKYFNLTPDGIPRFGVVTAWHESLTERD